MGALAAWYRRKTTVIAALLIAALLVATLLRSVELGPSKAAGPSIFTVSIEYFGIDAQEMEQLVTVPLEDAISNLAGIRRLRSISEYGKSSVEVVLALSAQPDRFYLALRDAVNAVYSTLPQDVQRPEIVSAASDQIPFFIATVSVKGATLEQTRDFADRTVKPALEQVDGVGDVEVAGGSQREVHVVVDLKKAASDGLSLDSIAGVLQSEYVAQPVGLLRSDSTELPIVLDGRFASLAALSSLPIPMSGSRIVHLGDIADVGYGDREVDTVSTIDGRDRVTLYVKNSGEANIVAVSRELRARLTTLSTSVVSFETVYDLGSDVGRSLLDVLESLVIAEVIVGLFVAIVLRPRRNALLVAALLPCVVLASAALLTAFGETIDQEVLSGVAVGVGLIVDATIVIVSALVETPPGRPRGATPDVVAELVSPLAASAATTLIVLVPLFYLGRTTPALAQISYALGSILLLSLGAALFFIPVFTQRSVERSARKTTTWIAIRTAQLGSRMGRLGLRALDIAVRASTARPRQALVVAGIVCVLGIVAVTRMDVILSAPSDERSVYAHVEYESGTSITAIDRRTRELASKLLRLPGVDHVETIARRGSADLTATISGARGNARRVRSAIETLGRQMAGAFVYLPRGTSGGSQSIEVSLIGPDNTVLRSVASQTAQLLTNQPWVTQVVLNFKPGPPTYEFSIDHEALAEYGVSTDMIASSLRWGMYGPVALKWLSPDSREMDLRVQATLSERDNLEAVEGTTILGSKGQAIPLVQLGSFKLDQPPARIYRTGRQRAVYFTVESSQKDTEAFLDQLQSYLAAHQPPAGYAYRIDQGVYDRVQQFKTLVMVLCGVLLLVFFTLAAQTESLTSPLLVMTVVPLCLAFPLLFLWITGEGIDVSVLVALIIMSGMVVNNAILILDRALARCERLQSYSAAEVRRSMRFAIRKRARPLFLTSTTTVLGLLPFLVGASSGSALFRPLAIVVLFGTVASIAASLLVLPAVAAVAPLFIRRAPVFRK